jgi:outer membrane protein assembly factor BamD (BamD/ComL family)
MQKSVKIYSAVSLFLLLYACTSPKEKLLGEIRNMEVSDSALTPQVMQKLKVAYVSFADKYPDDELAPLFLFRSAQRCNITAQHQEAITLLDRIQAQYPSHKIAEDALFLKGYIQENSMQLFEDAKNTYELFLQKYPKSTMAKDARLAIDFMGKSAEELWNIISDKQP